MQLKMYDGGKLLQAKALGMQRAAKTGEKMAVKSRRGMRQAAPAAKKAGRLQRLAMGAGTGIDLTFGVGKDGEPPYHIRGAAESVRNGLVNPAAPEVLPYAQVTGSGTSGRDGDGRVLVQRAGRHRRHGRVSAARGARVRRVGEE